MGSRDRHSLPFAAEPASPEVAALLARGLPPKEQVRRLLNEALDAFQKFLRTGRGNKKQRRKVMRQLREVIEEARRVAPLDFLDELSDEIYGDWLPYAEARNLASRTINDRVRALKRFGK